MTVKGARSLAEGLVVADRRNRRGYRLLKYLLVILIAILATNVPVCFGADDAPPTQTLEGMLLAVQQGAREKFLENSTPEMKETVDAEMFKKIMATYGVFLKLQHSLNYLGDMKKKGCTVYLYRMSFDQGRDDSLVTFSMRGQLVAGIYIN